MGTTTMSVFWIWPTLVVVGLALLGYLAYRLIRDRLRRTPAGTGSARRRLDERFARGEIDADDYRHRIAIL